ncbi:MAG: hypothetical protein WC497_05565 [Patescibacteria group bacterium]
MNLKKCLSDDEILQLARLSEVGPGQAFLKVSAYELERAQRDYDENPMVADGKKDFRFKAGLIEGIKTAERALHDARLMVVKSEERETS